MLENRQNHGPVQRKHVVLLVHGIRTQGEWQQRAAAILETEPTIRVRPTRYEFLDVVRFILPVASLRRRPILRITNLIRDELTKQPDHLSIVAHSFGTFIFSKILEDQSDIEFHRVVLCGSIIPDNFPWERFKHRLPKEEAGDWQVVNDCGLRDPWPVLAQSVTWGYGSSGRFGFGHGRVKDRFHPVDHSGFFSQDFIVKYWLPYLRNGEIIEGEKDRPTTSWWFSLLTVLKLRYFAVCGLAMLLVCAITPVSKLCNIKSEHVNDSNKLAELLTRDNKFPYPFFEPSLLDCGTRFRDAVFDPVLLSSPGKDCVSLAMEKVAAFNEPILLLGEPATGKGYLLTAIRSILREQGKPAVLVTIRHCSPDANGGSLIAKCQYHKIAEEVSKELHEVHLQSAIDDLDRSKRLWILIDGIDDHADPAKVIPLLRYIGDLSKKTNHLIVTARGESLAFIVSRHRNYEVTEAFAKFREIYLNGLSEKGIDSAGKSEIGSLKEGEAKKGRNSLRVLQMMKRCPTENADLANEILTRTPLLRNWLRNPTELRGNEKAICDPMNTKTLRKQLTGWLFDHYCRESLCGNEDVTGNLRDAIINVADTLSDPQIKSVDENYIKKAMQVVKGGASVTTVKVLRGLILSGLLHVDSGGVYKIREFRRHKSNGRD